MRRFGIFGLLTGLFISMGATAAAACGGLIGPRGSVNLLRTTTLAGYAGGIEHYITAFEFAGGGGAFGSLVPLPGIPAKVEKGGKWTLQRLVRETQPQQEVFALTAAGGKADRSAQVILETRIDALDITVLKGGGDEVGVWAKQNGFNLPPDAPEVLDFYAQRSPIFMAARFDATAARERGQAIGDGTPIHLTIPTDSPWVPLRILALGKQDSEVIQADVYLLTETSPRILPAPGKSMFLERSEPASKQLITDLRSDDGMDWIPESGMWLSYLRIDAAAEDLEHDLAVSVNGTAPSWRDAGLEVIDVVASPSGQLALWLTAAILALILAGSTLAARGYVRTAA